MKKSKAGSPSTSPAAKKGRQEATSIATPEITRKSQTTPPPAPAKSQQDLPLPAENIAAAAPSTANNQVPEKTTTFFLQFSKVAKPFNLPPHPEVALVAMEHFQQEGMKCIPFFIRGEKCYKLELREEVDKNGHMLQFKDFTIPLPAWERKTSSNTRQEGLLLTFPRAGVGLLESIPPEVFDKAMHDLKLNILVNTKMQRVKDTRVLNGNRFCVVETPANIKIIPESIPIEDPVTKERFQVHLNFKGQERYCNRCDEMHVGLCPTIQARIQAERERQTNGPNTVKMYADSTLRYVDVLGLRSEVLGMSGGGLGQVIQAVIDDPEGDQYEKVLILGGANDAKANNYDSNHQYEL